ncbi:hypothetical protein C8035_v003160 [Colletotrichum spinosum]|uniref:CENP-V/GFA domain-containing protein n=1 Tax=Colletotrichum spinosum TaxID=1347390 RepID=A0A4R8PWH6_9PEZI|nr:hypothetical protein C8035_v003160 [Colletotrichum spinosum]
MSHQTNVQTVPFPLQGGCACGNIRYMLAVAPLVIHCCHCTSCQRETGTGFALNALVEGDGVTLLPPRSSAATSSPPAVQAQPQLSFPASLRDTYTPKQSRPVDDNDSSAHETSQAMIPSPILVPVPTESGAPQHIARCPACLTPVWSTYGGMPLLKFLRVGSLDSPALLGGPDVYIFLRSKLPYIEIPDDDKPRFDAFYPQKEGIWGPEAMVRREKLLERIKAWSKETGVE